MIKEEFIQCTYDYLKKSFEQDGLSKNIWIWQDYFADGRYEYFKEQLITDEDFIACDTYDEGEAEGLANIIESKLRENDFFSQCCQIMLDFK